MRERSPFKALNAINPIPYSVHFDTQQNKPTNFFTAPIFPQYAHRCHEKEKLCTIMPFQQLYADMQRLGSIQFIGSQGVREGVDGLYALLDNTTNIAPYRNYPYVFGQFLIPQPQPSHEGGIGTGQFQETLQKAKESWENTSLLAKKGEFYTCDANKVEAIKSLTETGFVAKVYNTGADSNLVNPCSTYERAYYAGFNEFYYLHNIQDAAANYKVAAFNDGAPSMAPLMAAIIYGRGGNHLKSATLRFDRFATLKASGLPIDPRNIKPGEDSIVALSQTGDNILLQDAKKAFKKAIFEFQLQLLTDAEALVGSGGSAPQGCDKSYSCLQREGYIQKVLDADYTTYCATPQNKNTMRCILYAFALQNKFVSGNGRLTYPFEKGFHFARDSSYNSRRITTE